MYRVYLRTFDQRVSEKTNTPNQQAALDTFSEMINRIELDGQKLAAALTYNNTQLAFHRFDRKPGQSDYWRGRVDDIELPSNPVGAPRRMDGGKRANVYLDTSSRDIAAELGDGNVSDGIRIALKFWQDRTK